VCANEWSPSDGRVVSLDHGCGAHSETDMDHPEPTSVGDPIVDEFAVDLEPAERAAEDATPAEPTGEDETPVEEIPVEEIPTEQTSSVEAFDEEQHGSDDPVTD
jgi:hypothetical protein